MSKTQKAISRRNLLKGVGVMAGGVALAACAPVAAPPAAQPAQPASTSASTSAESTAPAAAPAAETTSAPAAAGATEVTYWGFSGALGETEQKLADMYHQTQSDVKVTLQVQGSYEETAQKLQAALAAKTAPEMVLLSDVWWFLFYRAQALMPLNELLQSEKVETADFVESLWSDGLRKDQQHWVPFARSTPLFYYNADLLAKAGLPDRGPETWAEFSEWAPKLVEKDGDALKVSAFAHPGAASYVAWIFQCVIRQFGGRYSDSDFNMMLTNDDSVRAGQFYQDSVNKLGWATAPQDPQKDFVNGLTAATILSTGGLSGILKDAQFKVGTAFLPKEKNFNCCTGGSGLSILTGTATDKAAAAMKYINYATGAEGGAFWSQNTGYMPVRKSTAASDSYTAFFEKVPQAKTAVDQLPETEPQDAARVFIPGGDQIIGKGLERIIVGKEDVKTVFQDVTDTLNKEAEPVKKDIAAMG